MALFNFGDKELKIHKLAFNGEWKEGANGVVRLEDDVSAVEALLQFMYTFDYDASGSAQNSSSPIAFNVKVYSIAEKYDVAAVETCWDMDDFPDAIARVYDSTPSVDRSLRTIVVDAACKHIDTLLSKQGFCDVLNETLGFASDMTQLLAKSQNRKRSPTRKYRCPDCFNHWEAELDSGSYYHCIRCGVRYFNWASYIV
ncbi:hypothetical protein BCR34DRAFT_625346 [Clohesyomyces aquaticus]|uniref:BTB domain-containing protein n=1 Tax=Clohesyomyces aquaticus TaxID=1231657 RepID=A0A1Y1ZJ70_9PLEO|nr:hypothetical protein BCR34DRAFT_625346 [Clohesyomyces aquaticus]